MKKYIKDNKNLLLKYLSIIITNIILYIFSEFYFNKLEEKYILMFFIVIICDLVIYYYKEKCKFKYFLDLIINFFIGIIFTILFNGNENLPVILLFIFFANNIIFMRSRKSDKFILGSLQNLLIPLISILNLFFNLIILYFI